VKGGGERWPAAKRSTEPAVEVEAGPPAGRVEDPAPVRFRVRWLGMSPLAPVAAAVCHWQKSFMDYEPTILESAVSKDGKKRWELLKRDDGFFAYNEDTFFVEDLSEFDAGTLEYWSPTHLSGLFDTAAEARKDSLGTLPWLGEVLAAN
jgi:hypothetical protein